MPDAPGFSFAVVCEASADRDTAACIADRILCERVDWLTPELADQVRRWRGLTRADPFLAWKDVRTHRDDVKPRIRVFGRFGGEQGQPDAWAARLALLLFAGATAPPDAVLLVRDSDGDLQRRVGLEQARLSASWPFPVVIAVAHPKRECWILAGFSPRDEREQAAHAALVDELSLDPVVHPDRLTAREHGAGKEPKRVLAALTGADRQRELECLRQPALPVLASRGASTGLAEFIASIDRELVPLLAGHRAG